jgi:LuxR family maltose regulon positive regulatory protein
LASKAGLDQVDHFDREIFTARYNPELFHLVELELITLARLFIAQGKIEQAVGILIPLSRETEKRQRVTSLIENLLLQSLSFHTQGDLASSIQALETAFTLAEPGGSRRAFLDLGQPLKEVMAHLLHHLENQNQSHDEHPCSLEKFIRSVILAVESKAESRSRQDKKLDETLSTARSSRVAKPQEALTTREAEVLALLANGLSNKDIAQRLVVAPGTVHKHLKNIYSKLYVHNRTAATARARELGWID